MNEKKLLDFFKQSPEYTLKCDNFFDIYDKLLKKFKYQNITLVEVGIGNGGSLYMWKKYFNNQSRIIGIDMNPEAKKFEKEGFEIFIGDQSDPKFWHFFYDSVGKIDILIDDGGHKNLQQITTVSESIENIRDNGLIIIEDTVTSYMKKKGFGNPSKYSFINYCNEIVESIHRRNPFMKKENNIFSKKVYSIEFFDSLVAIKISADIPDKSKTISNKSDNSFFVDYRHEGYYLKSLNFFNFFFKNIYDFPIIKKIIRKIFHRNLFFYFHEKYQLFKFFKKIKK